MSWPGVIERYRSFLPVTPGTPVISLGEGNTPLIPARRAGERAGGIRIFFKYEGMNPTGSFKDRGMTLAVTKALEAGAQAIVCASTGNTAASAAAFGARSGIGCAVILPKDSIALGKLVQALLYGADVVALEGSFDDAFRIMRRLVEGGRYISVNSINPYRIEGQKTAAFEVCEQLGTFAAGRDEAPVVPAVPDYLAIPVGNGGNITAYWKGFREYRDSGFVSSLPAMLGFQAAGSAPLVHGGVIAHPQTVATAIKIGDPAYRLGALDAAADSGGLIDVVSDEEILSAYRFLAAEEGIFAEPASAASIAGVFKLAQDGYFRVGETVVCVLTGHGLKDPDQAFRQSTLGDPVAAEYEAVEAFLTARREAGSGTGAGAVTASATATTATKT
ncbi:MAG: threonine synthase [Firmicutes bacterium]|nr:threonine synthase [Bacillota bacterium]